MQWQRSQEMVLFWFLWLWMMVCGDFECLCVSLLWWWDLKLSVCVLAVIIIWAPPPVTHWGVNLPDTGQITGFTAYCIRVCVCETMHWCVCVSFNILYVTAAVSQLLSSFPESLIQRLLGYCRAAKVSYCVFVSADGWAPIFIQAQEWVAKNVCVCVHACVCVCTVSSNGQRLTNQF